MAHDTQRRGRHRAAPEGFKEEEEGGNTVDVEGLERVRSPMGFGEEGRKAREKAMRIKSVPRVLEARLEAAYEKLLFTSFLLSALASPVRSGDGNPLRCTELIWAFLQVLEPFSSSICCYPLLRSLEVVEVVSSCQ